VATDRPASDQSTAISTNSKMKLPVPEASEYSLM
jgi:hypothetical protein